MAPICTSIRPISLPSGAKIANRTVCANPMAAAANSSVFLANLLDGMGCVIVKITAWLYGQ